MQSFAIIPAAGLSKRMGRPKLLMPWGETTLIERVLRNWRASRVSRLVAVVRGDEGQLIEACHRGGAEVVTADAPPPEMKDSVALGLEYLQRTCRPAQTDVWLLAPADVPHLSAKVVDRLLSEYGRRYDPARPTILVAAHQGQRGHPVLFPWRLAGEVQHLADDEGVDALLSRHPLLEIECGRAAISQDVDTPADYRRLQGDADCRLEGDAD